MEYTKKYKNLIAKLFKKAVMLEEVNIVRIIYGDDNFFFSGTMIWVSH